MDAEEDFLFPTCQDRAKTIEMRNSLPIEVSFFAPSKDVTLSYCFYLVFTSSIGEVYALTVVYRNYLTRWLSSPSAPPLDEEPEEVGALSWWPPW